LLVMNNDILRNIRASKGRAKLLGLSIHYIVLRTLVLL
jgi:hypothetical protein